MDNMEHMEHMEHMHHMNHSGMGMMGMDMHMNFYVGTNVTLFFKQWVLNGSVGKMVAACIGLIIVGVLYEGLKIWRIYIQKSRRQSSSTIITNRQANGTKIEEATTNTRVAPHNRRWLHWLQTLLHIVQVFVGYLLMLAFMTYNVWICLAVLIGSGLGYFIFGWIISPIDDMPGGDHCN